jgi:hypothetical protein
VGVIFKKKHVCPNRTTTKKPSIISHPSNAAKPTYYNKKGFQIKHQQQNQRWMIFLDFLLDHQNR